MTQTIITADNSCKYELAANQQAALCKFAGISLRELCQREKNLLIFPHSLGANEDDIGSQKLFDIAGGKLKTGNEW